MKKEYRVMNEMKQYVLELLDEYLNSEEETNDLAFKMSLLFELHRIADLFEKSQDRDGSFAICGSLNTYEQN